MSNEIFEPAVPPAKTQRSHAFRVSDLRIWLAVGVLGLMLAAGSVLAEAQNDDAGLVKIIARYDGQTRYGSGFIVAITESSTYLVTAAHVVKGDPRPEARFAIDLDRTYETQTVRVETGVDLAVLKVERKVPRAFALAFDDREVLPLDTVRVAGFARGDRQPHWNEVKISNAAGRLVMSQGATEATSGGPVLRERWVVGLMQGTLANASNAVPATLLLPVLKSWKIPLRGVADDLYSRPALIGAVADGDLSKVPDDQETRRWVFSYLAIISNDCNLLPSNAIMPAMRYVNYEAFKSPESMMMTGWGWIYELLMAYRELDFNRILKVEEERDPRIDEATRDALTFVERHGCSSARVRQFRDHLVEIVTSRSSRPPADGRASTAPAVEQKTEHELPPGPQRAASTPRRLSEPTRFFTSSKRHFVYKTSHGDTASGNTRIADERLASTVDQLTSMRYKCLASLQVSVTKDTSRVLNFEHYGGRQLYLILCSGDCRNLVYDVRPERDLMMAHYGVQLDFPAVLVIDRTMFKRTDALTFRKSNRADPSQSATVTVLNWSNRLGDYGSGCQF